MIKTAILATISLGLGALLALGIMQLRPDALNPLLPQDTASQQENSKPVVVGFLPYFLLDRADKDYAPFITTLTYYGLTIQTDGTIKKFSNPGEAEPGWHALNSGKIDPFLQKAKEDKKKLSLLIFNASSTEIYALVEEPEVHAQTLVNEVAPIMKQYGFTDLNLDLESFSSASDSSRNNFTAFVKAVRKNMQDQNLGTLSLEASPSDLIVPMLINLEAVAPHVDQIILMTYDFHYAGSSVAGPVAPVGGAGITAEFDTETAIQKALAVLPREKVIIGVPLYGYEWETVGEGRSAAVLPSSGQSASNRRIEELLSTCATCSAQWDNVAKESYVVYKNEETGLFHHAAFPDTQAMEAKIALAKTNQVGGLALWALGYEGSTILTPLKSYLEAN